MELPELEVICGCCKGEGSNCGSNYEDDLGRCGVCKGAGYVPTEFGEKVLAMLRHNFKPMLEDAMSFRMRH